MTTHPIASSDDKCFAADGVTPIFSFPGHPLMVRAVDFNRAIASHTAHPTVWRIQIGDSDTWGYAESESEADFFGRRSGLEYKKEPLYASPQLPVAQMSGDDEINRKNTETLLHALEIIAVGDTADHKGCAAEALVEVGFWESKAATVPQVAQSVPIGYVDQLLADSAVVTITDSQSLKAGDHLYLQSTNNLFNTEHPTPEYKAQAREAAKEIADVLKYQAAAPQPIAASPSIVPSVRLVELLRSIRPNFGDVGTRDVDVRCQQNEIDEAIALLTTASNAGEAAQGADK